MSAEKNEFKHQLVDIITPYIINPEQGNVELVIIEILNKIKNEMSYTCSSCLNEMDEFYGRIYGASKIDVNDVEKLIYKLQIMRQSKTDIKNK